jgi:hypothetical protein
MKSKSLVYAIPACILCVLAMVATARAQQSLNFADLPLINMPSPMPNGCGHMDWGNDFYYVNPEGWLGAGRGFKLGP